MTTATQPSAFGQRLAKIRQGKQLTQLKLAEQTGLGYGTMQALEQKPTANPTLATLRSLARVLDVTLCDLMGEE